jgi:SNF2 family DNA or RNA helicase
MINLVRKNHLGTEKDFRNQYENPIKAGQSKNSTKQQVRTMKQRTHALSNSLEGFVQRRNASLLMEELQRHGVTKQEYVIKLALSPLQARLAMEISRMQQRLCLRSGSKLLSIFQRSLNVGNHPYCLRVKQQLVERNRGRGNKRGKRKREAGIGVCFDNDSDEEMEGEVGGGPWWAKALSEVSDPAAISHSGKFVALVLIVKVAVQELGEKVVVFSQSLSSIEFIERVLKKEFSWRKGRDYDRIDGTVSSVERKKLADRFNKKGVERKHLKVRHTCSTTLAVLLLVDA